MLKGRDRSPTWDLKDGLHQKVVSKHRTTKTTFSIFYARPNDTTPDDPAPWLGVTIYDLPFVYVARDSSPLTGRAHANKLGRLSLKTDQNIKNAPAFTLGPLMASTSFANMSRTIVRQSSTLGLRPRDHHLIILLGDIPEDSPSRLRRLVDMPGYTLSLIHI